MSKGNLKKEKERQTKKRPLTTENTPMATRGEAAAGIGEWEDEG